MRDIIQRHNRLNGLWFSLLEFGLIAVCIGAFATYYLVHYRVLFAIISWGITLNCVPVVVYALRALREQRMTRHRMGTIWDKQARAQLRRENPHMLQDTLVLTVATLIPFAVVTAVLYERIRASKP